MDIADHLHGHRKSLTRARTEIWRILTQSEKPLSPKEIHRRLTVHKVDPATVYRNLRALKDVGLVREIDLRETFKRYEAILPGRHVHHIMCQVCGRIEKVRHCVVQDMADAIQKESGFTLEDHYLECFGICPNCQGI
ncbi:MAG: Fur family transcriptional regulator [Thermodesulfobacteriota bacterium]